MRRTLEMTVVEGIKTSIPLHLKILSEPDFVAGRLSTSFMDRFMKEKKSETSSRSRRRQWPEANPRVLAFPRLYPILDLDLVHASGRQPLDVLDAWLEAGMRLVQLRMKNGAAGTFSRWPMPWFAAVARRARASS